MEHTRKLLSRLSLVIVDDAAFGGAGRRQIMQAASSIWTEWPLAMRSLNKTEPCWLPRIAIVHVIFCTHRNRTSTIGIWGVHTLHTRNGYNGCNGAFQILQTLSTWQKRACHSIFWGVECTNSTREAIIIRWAGYCGDAKNYISLWQHFHLNNLWKRTDFPVVIRRRFNINNCMYVTRWRQKPSGQSNCHCAQCVQSGVARQKRRRQFSEMSTAFC